MTFGLSLEQYSFLEKHLLRPLFDKNVEIYVFGSRARGDNHKYSDIDILISPKEDLPIGYLSQIKEDLENSNLEIKVDIVEDKFLASSYREKVDLEKVKIMKS